MTDEELHLILNITNDILKTHNNVLSKIVDEIGKIKSQLDDLTKK